MKRVSKDIEVILALLLSNYNAKLAANWTIEYTSEYTITYYIVAYICTPMVNMYICV